jgi:hypothetical protein
MGGGSSGIWCGSVIKTKISRRDAKEDAKSAKKSFGAQEVGEGPEGAGDSGGELAEPGISCENVDSFTVVKK